MTQQEVFEKVKAIILDTLTVKEAQVTMEANLVEDLNADSLDAVEVITQLEDTFNITIDDEAAQNVKTVGDLVNSILANVK